MNNRTDLTYLSLAVMMWLLLVSIPVSAQEEMDLVSGPPPVVLPAPNPHSFTGTWLVQAQITNCSGVTLETFSKHLSIHAGGTANEMSNSISPALRTTAFGVWQNRNQGDFVYALRFFRFNPDGTFFATVHAKWTVSMADVGDAYTATGAIQVVLPNGTVAANLCGTETGNRMLIPN